MKDTLYDQLLKAIADEINYVPLARQSNAATACQTISEEWAKGFAEWIDEGLWAKTESHGEGYRPTKKWYNTHNYAAMKNPLTTDELIQLYKNSEHGKH